jgi:hypothetical protein
MIRTRQSQGARLGTLGRLRDLVPIRPLTQLEALRVAELQATRFLELAGVHEPPVPETLIAELPKISIRRVHPWPVSGCTEWVNGSWVVVLNSAESPARQRFTLSHEFKHILDHRFIEIIYPASEGFSSSQRAEIICDYFAGCLLIPTRWLGASWEAGYRSMPRLAQQFRVSEAAIYTRLVQIGLAVRRPRCSGVRSRAADRFRQ